jgi:hypothetical protein
VCFQQNTKCACPTWMCFQQTPPRARARKKIMRGAMSSAAGTEHGAAGPTWRRFQQTPPRRAKKNHEGDHVARRIQSMGQLVLHGCAFSKHRRARARGKKMRGPMSQAEGAKHFICAASQDVVLCNTIHKNHICIEFVQYKLESFRVVPKYK